MGPPRGPEQVGMERGKPLPEGPCRSAMLVWSAVLVCRARLLCCSAVLVWSAVQVAFCPKHSNLLV